MSKENQKHKNKTSNNCKKEELKKKKFMEKPPPSSDSDKEISDIVESTGEEEVKQIKSHIITLLPQITQRVYSRGKEGMKIFRITRRGRSYYRKIVRWNIQIKKYILIK